jgi:pyridoxine 4-dehydrogenase
LAAACNALAETVAAGLCRAWGIASWDPRSVVKVIDEDAPGIQPRVLLLRAGLSVAHPVLSAGEQVCRVLGVAPDCRWGMSPFGGSTSSEAWHAANLGAFLQPEQRCSTLQAAFRLAYELPPVSHVAVGARACLVDLRVWVV